MAFGQNKSFICPFWIVQQKYTRQIVEQKIPHVSKPRGRGRRRRAGGVTAAAGRGLRSRCRGRRTGRRRLPRAAGEERLESDRVIAHRLLTQC